MTTRLAKPAGRFIQNQYLHVHLFNVIGLECLLNTHAHTLAPRINVSLCDVCSDLFDHCKCDELHFVDYIIHFSLSLLVVVVVVVVPLSDLTACEILINDVQLMMAH